RVCLRLPSDSASRRTPLPLANSSYCQACSGLSPPSYRPCRAHYKKRPLQLRRDAFLLFLLIKPPRLGPVTAIRHGAPAAASVAARIEKQPSARITFALFDSWQIILGDEQIYRRLQYRRQHPIQWMIGMLEL